MKPLYNQFCNRVLVQSWDLFSHEIKLAVRDEIWKKIHPDWLLIRIELWSQIGNQIKNQTWDGIKESRQDI